MAAERPAFIINPARARDPGRLRQRCRAVAAAHGYEPLLLAASAADPGTGLCRQALAAGAGTIVAVGGDGTVRACAQAMAGGDVPLAIVPTGTANLAARALGIPRDLGAALAVAFDGTVHRIDVAEVTAHVAAATVQAFVGADSQASGVISVAMAGVGLDAEVVAATLGWLRGAGWLAYAVSGVAHLSGPMNEFTLRVDGAEAVTRRARCVVVGNAGLLPGGFAILPAALLDDGILDIGILAASRPLGWTSVALRVLGRSRRDDRYLERLRCRRVEVASAADLLMQVDGEVIARTRRLTVEVRPAALPVRVPAKG